MKPFNANKIYNFVFIERTVLAEGGVRSFRGYTDRQGVFKNPGAYVYYDDGTTNPRGGQKVGKQFTLDQSHYNIQTRDGQKDYKGLSMYDFLMNSNVTWGSPNGIYQYAEGGLVPDEELLDRESLEHRLETGEIKQIGALIKLMNTGKDAEIALEVARIKNKAESSALELDEETLQEIAAHIGVYGDADELMRKKVFDFASKRPQDYFKTLQAGDRGIRAIIRKSLANGTFTKRGEVIYWDETVIGGNEDAAVSKLLSEKAMLEALQEASKLQTDIKVKGKPGPKPKKVEA